MKDLVLSDKLKLGCATAATQIEGGDINSNWYFWSMEGKIKNNESSLVACDHYNRYPEDIEILSQLNQEIYRMSIEWSRIEPMEGRWSEEGIAHYVDEIRLLKEKGIQPLVTLHHFSCPQWLQEKGAWTNPKVVNYFSRFVKKVVIFLGDMVSEYCTINEPNVFANDTYIDGKYPPGKKDDMKSYFKASKHMILAHLKSYQLIHQLRKERGFKGETKVGFAHHLAALRVKGKNPLTNLSRMTMDYSFHSIFFKGMVEGKLSFPMGHGYPFGKGIFCDFLGINYYSRHIIKSTMNLATLFGEVTVEEGLGENQYNDLGWEIYPKGLGEVLRPVYKKYQLPIYITENGIPDEKDEKRAKFIYDHLKTVAELMEEGIDIQRFYYWSLLDNLEWNDGYGPRFGLVEVNYDTQERRIRESARFYSRLCAKKKMKKDELVKYIG